jgi:hypothetical protein
MSASPTRLAATFVAATSLTCLKPRLKKALRPWVAYLARSGVTANQVTVTSLIGSAVVGGPLCVFAAESGLFAILPAWLVARTACATIDGTLAIEFGQKSRLGGILNGFCQVGAIVTNVETSLCASRSQWQTLTASGSDLSTELLIPSFLARAVTEPFRP